MKLTIHAEGQAFDLDVPNDIVREGEAFFAKLDRDMDKGWQLGTRWIEAPDKAQRCSIAADQMLSAMHGGKVELTLMLAAYILNRSPGASFVRFGEEGDAGAIEIG